MIRRSVVFPHPEGPRIVTNCPVVTERTHRREPSRGRSSCTPRRRQGRTRQNRCRRERALRQRPLLRPGGTHLFQRWPARGPAQPLPRREPGFLPHIAFPTQMDLPAFVQAGFRHEAPPVEPMASSVQAAVYAMKEYFAIPFEEYSRAAAGGKRWRRPGPHPPHAAAGRTPRATPQRPYRAIFRARVLRVMSSSRAVCDLLPRFLASASLIALRS